MAKKKQNFNVVLSIITNDIVGKFKLDELLEKIVDLVMGLLNADVCSIFLDDKQNEPKKTITMKAGSGFAKKLVNIATYDTGEGLTGYIYETGKIFNIKSQHELQNLKREKSTVSIWAGKHDDDQWVNNVNEFKNLIGVPLKIKDEIFGVIKVENKKGSETYFNDDDQTIFEIIANVVSLAIENARLVEKLEKDLKAISGKAAHRIFNITANYDGIEKKLNNEVSKGVCDVIKIKELIERQHEATKNLKSLTDEIKQFAKPLQINKTRCNLNEIIGDEIWYAQESLDKESHNTIRIYQELDKNLPEIEIDKDRFPEAIKELIRNSVKAINSSTRKNEGKITIVTKYDDINKAVSFRIEDNGTGFPKDLRIFEAFISMYPNSTGLGLTTVRELVQRHGGTINNYNLENTSGAGIEIIFKS